MNNIIIDPVEYEYILTTLKNLENDIEKYPIRVENISNFEVLIPNSTYGLMDYLIPKKLLDFLFDKKFNIEEIVIILKIYFIITGSLQYKFWYVKNKIRKCNYNSQNLINDIQDIFIYNLSNSIIKRIFPFLFNPDKKFINSIFNSLFQYLVDSDIPYKEDRFTTLSVLKHSKELNLHNPVFLDDPFFKKGQLVINGYRTTLLYINNILIPDSKDNSYITDVIFKNNFNQLEKLIPVDYRIPQALIHLGILDDPNLNNLIHQYDEKLISFRFAVLNASNMLSERYNLSLSEIDSILFNYAKNNNLDDFHTCDTTFY